MAKKKQESNNYGKYIKRFWLFYFSFIVFILLLFVSISIGVFGFMPSFEELENPKSNLASEIISADQELLGKYYIENRSTIHYRDLSTHVRDALIATEDIRFEVHSGIDEKAIVRVVFGLMTGRSRGGGSTLTQQLAKNLFPRDKQSFIIIQKFKEWITAIKLERNYSKEEILAMYLNVVDFGSHAFGIKSASNTFFNKSADSLNVEEAALMIGVLRAPSFYSPVRNPERAKKRREVVLNQMRRYNFLTDDDYDSLKVIPIDMSNYQVQDHRAGLGTYFREYLRVHLRDWAKTHEKPNGKPYNLYKDGLKIYTTINSKMQRYAEEAVREHIGGELQPEFFKHWKGRNKAPFWRISNKEYDGIMKSAINRSDRYRKLKKADVPMDSIMAVFNTPTKMRIFTWEGDKDTIMTPLDSIKYFKYFLLCGMMSMEPQTGFVKAYVGGIDYRYFQYDHVTQSKRQVGSTFKPFLYTLAMQEGAANGEFSPCTEVLNVQQSIDLPTGKKWEPRNSSHEKEGEMVSLSYALAHSINWISAYLIIRYSPEAVITISRNMGITSDIDPVPSICLGTPDISVCEMVGAMSTFAGKGIYKEPIFITRIEDKNGNIIENFLASQKQKEAMDEETAYLMLELLKGVVRHGTGQRLGFKYNLHMPIAGKTGTTQNNSDGWFMGITPDLVTGIWVGCEDRSSHFRSIRLGQGANMALPIWAIYMKKVYADENLNISQGDFEKPKNELHVEIDCDKWKVKQKNKIVFD